MAKQRQLASVPEPQVPLPDVDHGLGEIVIPIQWEALGEISRFESAEVKQRNKSLERLNDDIAHLATLRAIATNEKVTFLRRLAENLGGGPRDEFNINDETGLVHRTGYRRYAAPAPEVEPTIESTDDVAVMAPSGDTPEGPLN